MTSLRLLATAALLVPTIGFAATSKSTANDMMGAMFDGPPTLASTKLDASAYEKTRVQKLAKAEIVYVNWTAIGEVLKSLGFENPPTTLTPELAQAILDKAGYAMKMPGEPESAYMKQFRDLYSIRYGGHWINNNFGSGRNGAGGVVDTKGIGKTNLVRPWSDGGHGSGTMYMTEAVHEAIWSNVLHEELPFGANRVLFIIATGTNIDGDAPGAAPRVILVREDPMRPAYFQQNGGVYSYEMEQMSEAIREYHQSKDDRRMKKLLPKLVNALPKPRTLRANATPAEKLRAGYLEFVDRSAYVYASAYTRQIILSGVSTSNTQIDGTALDFGATTAVLGYPHAKLPIGESPHGTTESLKNDLILEWARDLRQILPDSLLKGLPSDEELSARLDQQFELRVLQGMLELAGAPKELSLEAVKTPAGLAFAEVVLKIARTGNLNERPVTFGEMPNRRDAQTYNLGRVLDQLVSGNPTLLSELKDADLYRELTLKHEAYKAELTQLAAPHGITESALQTYAEKAVAVRNRSLVELVWDRKKSARLDKAEADYLQAKKKTGQALSMQDFIDRTVSSSIREYKSEPFTMTAAFPRSRVQAKIDLKSGTVTYNRLAPKTCFDLFSRN